MSKDTQRAKAGLARESAEARHGARDRAAQLERFVEALPYGCVEVDLAGRISLANAAVAALTGFEREAIVGSHFEDFVPPEEHGRLRTEWQAGLQAPGSSASPQAYRIRTKDGVPKTVRVRTIPVTHQEKLRGFQVLLEDITEYRQATDALKASEQKYEALVENLEDVVYSLDLGGKLTFVSSAVERFGYRPKDLLGQSFLAFVEPEDRPHAEADFRKTVETGEPTKTLWRGRDDEGAVHYFEDASVPFRDETGKIVGVMGALRDVTDKQQAAEAVRRGEERFRHLAELLPQGVFEIDAEGKFLFANRKALEYGGYAAEGGDPSVTGLDMVVPEDRERAAARLAAVMAGEELRAERYTALRKDGSTYPVLVYAGRMMAGDEVQGVRGLVVDISDIVKAEEALREGERRYRRLFEEAPVALWEVDLSAAKLQMERLAAGAGKPDMAEFLRGSHDPAQTLRKLFSIVDVNQAAVRLMEAESKQELVAKIASIFVEGSAERLAAHIATMAGGKRAIEIETVIGTVKGNRRNVYASWQITPEDAADWSHVLVGFIDITYRKAAEVALEQRTRELMQAEKLALVGRMASGISHEINQPLTAMHAYTDNTLVLLEQGRLADVRSNLTLTRELLTRAAEITKQLKMLASGTPGRIHPVSLKKVVNNVLAFLAATAKSRRIEVERHVPRDDLIVRADMVRLEQVLMNLLNNAFDAIKGRRTRTISVQLREDAGNAVLSVRDTGRGIPDRDLDTVFDPFFTTKKKGKGMGLGLSVSLGIVREYNGTITAENHPDGGALFTVTLPLTEEVEN